MTATEHATMTFDEAAGLTRTGDIWLFRGSSTADRAIRALTNLWKQVSEADSDDLRRQLLKEFLGMTNLWTTPEQSSKRTFSVTRPSLVSIGCGDAEVALFFAHRQQPGPDRA